MDNEELLFALKDMFEKKSDELKSFVDEKINSQSVLIESLRSDIKAVAEGHNNLHRKIEILDKTVEDVTNEIKSEIKIVGNYVIAVDSKLNEHEIILKRVK